LASLLLIAIAAFVVRPPTYREDSARTNAAHAPQVLAALRNTALTLLHRLGFKPVEGLKHFATPSARHQCHPRPENRMTLPKRNAQNSRGGSDLAREVAPVKKSIYNLIDLRGILLGCNRRSGQVPAAGTGHRLMPVEKPIQRVVTRRLASSAVREPVISAPISCWKRRIAAWVSGPMPSTGPL
jgi:hypothetical protein